MGNGKSTITKKNWEIKQLLPGNWEMLLYVMRTGISTTTTPNSGFYQIEVDLHDCEKTAFVMHHGLFQYNHIPFGLFNVRTAVEESTRLLG